MNAQFGPRRHHGKTAELSGRRLGSRPLKQWARHHGSGTPSQQIALAIQWISNGDPPILRGVDSDRRLR